MLAYINAFLDLLKLMTFADLVKNTTKGDTTEPQSDYDHVDGEAAAVEKGSDRTDIFIHLHHH